MGKRSKKRRVDAGPPGEVAPPANNGWRKVLPLLVILIIGVIAMYVVGYRWGTTKGDSAPFGVALPSVPTAIEYEGVDTRDKSLLENRATENWLVEFAPQQDGLPPLVQGYRSHRGDYTFSLTVGTELTMFPHDSYLKDRIEASTSQHFDNPIHGIQWSHLAREEGEAVNEYAARLRGQLETDGCIFYEDNERVVLDNYRFEHFEYYRSDRPEEYNSHFIYIGPLGARVLVADFMTSRGHHELARPFVEKIVRSFKPGDALQRKVNELDPYYAGKAAEVHGEPTP